MNGNECCEPAQEGLAQTRSQPTPVTVMERLSSREDNLQEQLKEVRRAKEILEKNPEMEELLSILGRTGGLIR